MRLFPRIGATSWAALLLAAAPILASCGGEGTSGPPEPVPADVILTLEGAVAGDRAVLLEIGSGATAVTAGSAQVEVHARPYLRGWVVAVFGPMAGQPLLRISVPDRNALPTVTLKEIATESGDLRAELAAYSPRLEVVK